MRALGTFLASMTVALSLVANEGAGCSALAPKRAELGVDAGYPVWARIPGRTQAAYDLRLPVNARDFAAACVSQGLGDCDLQGLAFPSRETLIGFTTPTREDVEARVFLAEPLGLQFGVTPRIPPEPPKFLMAESPGRTFSLIPVREGCGILGAFDEPIPARPRFPPSPWADSRPTGTFRTDY